MLPTLLSFGTDPVAHEFVVPALCKLRKGRGTPLFCLCQQSQKPGPPAQRDQNLRVGHPAPEGRQTIAQSLP